MKNEFIPYEEALAMKELGFDEESCTGYYNHSLCHWKTYKNHNESNRKVTAPLYQQAFRWFRERYGLKHHIWAGKISTVFYGYDIVNIDEQEFVVNNTAIGGGDCDFETYEEAELACLRKLIEIVNQNKDE